MHLEFFMEVCILLETFSIPLIAHPLALGGALSGPYELQSQTTEEG